VAAAKNGHGVVGVAPGVKVAAIRVADNAGLFYSEAVVCAFMHAAEKRMQVRVLPLIGSWCDAVFSTLRHASPWVGNPAPMPCVSHSKRSAGTVG